MILPLMVKVLELSAAILIVAGAQSALAPSIGKRWLAGGGIGPG